MDMKIKKLYRYHYAVQRGASEVNVPVADKMTTYGAKASNLAAYYEKWSEIKHSAGYVFLSFHNKLLEFIMDHIIVYPSTSMRDYCLRENIERELQLAGLARYRPRTFDQLQRHVKVILRRQPRSSDVNKNAIRKSLARLYNEYQLITADPPSGRLSRATGPVTVELLLFCRTTADGVRDSSILALAGVVEWNVETLVKVKAENFRTSDGNEWFFDNFERRKARWIKLPLEVTWCVLPLILLQRNNGPLFTGNDKDGSFALSSPDIVEIIARRLGLYALAQQAKSTGSRDESPSLGPELQSALTRSVHGDGALIGYRRQAALAAQIRERRRKRVSFTRQTHEAEVPQELADANRYEEYIAECGDLDRAPQLLIKRSRTNLIAPLSAPELRGGLAEVMTCSAPQEVQRPRTPPDAPAKRSMQPIADHQAISNEDYFPEDWDSAVLRFLTHKSNRRATDEQVDAMDQDDPSDEEWSAAILQIVDQDDEGN